MAQRDETTDTTNAICPNTRQATQTIVAEDSTSASSPPTQQSANQDRRDFEIDQFRYENSVVLREDEDYSAFNRFLNTPEIKYTLDRLEMEDLALNNPDLFPVPPPISGVRTSMEVVHYGLGEYRPTDTLQQLKYRKYLLERSESKRRSRKEYYEQLMKELAKSAELQAAEEGLPVAALGKRARYEKHAKLFGVPEVSASPSDLHTKLKHRQLGNYPTPPEVAKLRIAALEADAPLFEVLELGCGDGSFLLALSARHKAAYLKGVDVDSTLIESAAIQTRTARAGQVTETLRSVETDSIPVCFRRRGKQLPLTLSRVVIPDGIEKNLAPQAAGPSPERNPVPVFEIENVIHQITNYVEQQFDTVICLSVVKWVHLNWGDKGLTRLLLKFYNSLRVGGNLVLDIHNWKSYKNKKKSSQAMEYNYSSLQIKPNGVLERLDKLGFQLVKEIPHGFETGIKRPIFILKKLY